MCHSGSGFVWSGISLVGIGPGLMGMAVDWAGKPRIRVLPVETPTAWRTRSCIRLGFDSIILAPLASLRGLPALRNLGNRSWRIRHKANWAKGRHLLDLSYNGLTFCRSVVGRGETSAGAETSVRGSASDDEHGNHATGLLPQLDGSWRGASIRPHTGVTSGARLPGWVPEVFEPGMPRDPALAAGRPYLVCRLSACSSRTLVLRIGSRTPIMNHLWVSGRITIADSPALLGMRGFLCLNH